MNSPDQTSPLSESIKLELAGLLSSLSRDLDEGAKLKKFVQRLQGAWTASDGSAGAVLKDNLAGLLAAKYPQTQALISKMLTDVERQRSARYAELERIIRSYAEEKRQPCQGRFPALTIAHFIEVAPDIQTGRTKVGAVSVQSMSWEKIRPVLDREIARVWERPLDAAAFRDTLLSVYDLLEARSHTPTGHVRLDDVYRELKARRAQQDPKARKGGRLVAYYRDEFCADLSKLWQAQMNNELHGTQLEFTAIRRADEGFSVILPGGDIATFGFIRPRRQGQ